MKVLKITFKNLKLLMRSKTSMFVTIFGPLLIMLFVGFAFNNPSASKLNVGYYSPEKNNLTLAFIEALSDNQYFFVAEYNSQESCVEMIEQGKVHVCVIFPKDFEISNNQKNELIFYVDQSRTNFVYAILDTINKKISIASTQLSTQLTNELLSVIVFSQKTNNENIAKIIALKSSISDLNKKISDIKSKLGSIDLSAADIDSSDLINKITALSKDVDTLRNNGKSLADSSYSLIESLNQDGSGCSGNCTSIVNSFESDVDLYNSEINKTHNLTKRDILKLSEALDSLDQELNLLNERLSNARDTTTSSASTLSDVQSSIDKIKEDIDSIKIATEKVNAQINALKVTSAENIVSPITTRVEPVTAKSNNLSFIFPYLVILMILFISIMLSSTIIIIEKTSRAYFRNFTTPTKDFTFIASVFLTSFFVIIIQLIFVLIIAYYFLNTTILTNIYLTILTLLIAIIVFVFLGMIIGYLFNSQEAVTMAAISVGSVLLFLSNLVLPLETMSVVVQQVAKYNPYVIASELLKKVTLFNQEWNLIKEDILLLMLFAAVFFFLAITVHKMSKIKYISKKPLAKQIVKKRKEELVDKYFKLRTGILIRDEKELLKELRIMSDTTFSEYVSNTKNEFYDWLVLIGKTELAKYIEKSRTREEMILAIENYFKKIK
ncbi:MAG: hypothetical protein KatS3mg002_0519 [Candidatus Woesearchaeota archaeon]|nr:MAG: hypothetical protein KatS3mg002_0519 [Candidatus Woesearchaeota archaeon]